MTVKIQQFTFNAQGGISGIDYIDVPAGGSPVWGGITGTLANQVDLQAALDGKQVAGTYATGTGSASGTNTGDNATNTQYSGLEASKQATLVSGTNIKTINGSSVLGSGDLVVSGADPFTAKLVLAGNIATGANTTPVNLTGMSFSYIAASTYAINIYGIVQAAAATTGHGFGVNCTSAPVIVSLAGSHQLANTGTWTGWSSVANNAIAGVTSGRPGTTINLMSVGGGVLRTHATTAGTCQFIFRSETTAVTTCMAGTVITVMKVA